MAKMFYSLEEAAARLKKPIDAVRQMSGRGELTEFRDGDRLLFKVDQVDLLAGDEEHDSSEMSSMIPLADTGAGTAIGAIGLADSGMGSASSMASSRVGVDPNEAKEKSGIPVFDVDELDLADPSAVTQVTETAIGDAVDGGLRVESLGSGSGLMDLTRESDDTSLGAAGLLDELYPAQEEQPGASTKSGGSGLFEGAAGAAEPAGDAPVLVAAAAEVYDGPGSGLSGGLALGALIAAGFALAILIMARVGMPTNFVSMVGGENAPLMWTGIFAGATVLFAGLGFVVGKKSA
jgi:hypothetical protein